MSALPPLDEMRASLSDATLVQDPARPRSLSAPANSLPASPLNSLPASPLNSLPASPLKSLPASPVCDMVNHAVVPETFEPDVIQVANAFLQANNVHDGRGAAEHRKNMRMFGRRAFVKRVMSMVRVPDGDFGKEVYDKFLLFMMTSPDFCLQQHEYGKQVELAACFEVRNRIQDFF